jgi:hypothetical protein
MNVTDYKYIGFGGFKFYDFEMLFRHLGIRDMISIERDPDIFARCRFNKPFEFIEFHEGDLKEYVTGAALKKPVVAWLDFDSNISREIVDDILTVATRVPVGSFVFATLDARMPDGFLEQSIAERRTQLENELEGYSLIQSDADLEPSNFPYLAERIAWAALAGAFTKRTDGVFVPLIRAFYKDGAPMLTVGAAICDKAKADVLIRKRDTAFPFLAPAPKSSPPYSIPPFNLTTRERILLDSAATSAEPDNSFKQQLIAIGFAPELIEEYGKVVRFIPRYIEAYL